MQRQRVSSSNLASVGYDEKSSTLEIAFHGGRIYQYDGVPKPVYDSLMSAGSPGSFFDANVKRAYGCRRV